VVQQSWSKPVDARCPLQLLADKLSRLSRDLQSWSQKKIGHVIQQLQLARELVHQLEIAQDSRMLSSREEWLRRRLKGHVLGLSSLERSIARMCSRLHWLKDGDANTAYFHHHARYRKKKNFMAKVKVGDRMITEQEEKKEAVWDFYNSLLGHAQHRSLTLDLQNFHRPAADLSDLDQIIAEEEVWGTIRAMPSDKAPGPDGYTGRFYKAAWQVIKADFMAAISRLLQGDVTRLYPLNSACITLLPKKTEAIEVKDYRPISLVHSFAKIVTKTLANRLAPKLSNLVSAN
jgi:hypothetical protein